jgi:hypothetical protein
MPRSSLCCACYSNGTDRRATCAGCACAKAKKACTNCSLGDNCKNQFGHGSSVRSDVLICPVVGCTAGKGQKPLERALADASRVRQHVNEHLANGDAFTPSADWLSIVNGQMCKMCSAVITGLRDAGCPGCRASAKVPEMRAPRARGVPKLDKIIGFHLDWGPQWQL